MTMIYKPEPGHPLYKIWPDGVTGEVIHRNKLRTHMRIRMPGNTAWNPKHTVLVVPHNRVKPE